MISAASDASLLFLRDGGQTPEAVATELVAFLDAASQSLDIAIYDCALSGAAGDSVAGALRRAADHGIVVRIAYYSGPHRSSLLPPPAGSSAAFVDGLGIAARPVTGFHALMHHKYVIRDAGRPQATVWTGSTNWTNDAWAREENVILRLPSAELAHLYRSDFEDLWTTQNVDNSGERAGGTASLQFGGEPAPTRVWFSPAEGEDMAHAVADCISAAKRQIVLATPVLTVGSILGALRDVLRRGAVPVRGVYDRTQMEEAMEQWSESGTAAWKVDAFKEVAERARLAGKRSTPFSDNSVHDYMHVKSIVVDDSVFAGSYNFSHSGEENAENLLRIDSPALARTFADYIDRLIARYGAR